MEEKKQWITETEPKWYLQQVCMTMVIVGIVMAAAAGLYFQNVGLAIMVLVISLFCLAFLAVVLKGRPPVRLSFVGAELHIRNMDQREYDVFDIPASDFICKQNARERKSDVGRIRIKGTAFTFYGVRYFEQTQAYIRENFPA